MTLEQLKHFFATHPAIKTEVLSREAGLPIGRMSHIIRPQKYDKDRRNLTPYYIEKLLPVLKRYGYQELQENRSCQGIVHDLVHLLLNDFKNRPEQDSTKRYGEWIRIINDAIVILFKQSTDGYQEEEQS